MTPTKSKILALILILSHLLGFGLHSVFHNDLTIFSSAQEHQVFPHEDADHCKHIPLSEHSDCPICISHQSRIAPDQNPFFSSHLQIIGKTKIVSSVPSLQTHLFGSFSRRGPPFLLG
jgi:hypothetical protein